MTLEELKKLNKHELLEVFLVQSKKLDALKQELSEANRAAQDRRIKIENAGSIAEASLKLSKVFEEAQKSADQYLENVRLLNQYTEETCQKQKNESEEYCRKIMEKSEDDVKQKTEEADAFLLDLKQRANEEAEKLKKEAAEYSDSIRFEADKYSAETRAAADTDTKHLKEQAELYCAQIKSKAEAEAKALKDEADKYYQDYKEHAEKNPDLYKLLKKMVTDSPNLVEDLNNQLKED